MKILITDRPLTPPRLKRQEDAIREYLPGAEVATYDFQSREGLLAAARDADGVLTSFTPLDAATLGALPNLKVISISATGCGNVDLASAHRAGVVVCTVGEYCTEEVADHTLALMLALARHIKRLDRAVQSGGWEVRWEDPGPPLLLGRTTLGIYGFGRIGRAVALRSLAFGMTVLTPDRPSARSRSLPGVELVSEDELLARSDVISDHMPQSPATEGYFGAQLFARMAKKPIFLNLGRGATVDEYALADALDRGEISAAGLDVLTREAPLPADHPLLHRDNVIITPHAAFSSEYSMQVLSEQPAKNLAACLAGHPEQSRFRIA